MPSVQRFILALLFVAIASSTGRGAESEKPRLVVVVVFDQMRGDYVKRWQPLFVEGGFARLQKEGAWFTNCHYPYASTATGPGHSSILTGCCPNQHGIINNEWYDTKSATIVNCSESSRYQRVPVLVKKAAEPSEPAADTEPKKEAAAKTTSRVKFAGSPDYLLAPTLGDALKEATGGKSRVVGLSFKDRSAILPVGKSADAAYWLDSTDGMMVTSSCYRDAVHPWIAEFNEKRLADQWFGKDWTRLLPDLDYAKYSGPDETAGEGTGVKQGIKFPHPTTGGLKKPGKAYYDALFNSPYGNDMLFDIVRKAVVAEKLGKDEVTDLLVVSFSSNDAIGHTWGPDSQEVLDVTLRSDRIMAELLTFLDKKVGQGKYYLAMTADHGICPLPEATSQKGTFAIRISAKKLLAGAEEHLRGLYDKEQPVDPKSVPHWIESEKALPWIYLNQRLIADRKLDPAEVAKALAGYLAAQEGIERLFTRAELNAGFPATDELGCRMKLSYYPERCGDVCLVLKPYCLLTESYKTGTNHGSPHRYDSHVPLLIFGPGIKAGVREQMVTPQSIATILAQAAGVAPPRMAAYPAPDGLFERK